MSKIKIRKGDTVKVIAGKYKGEEGKVLEVLTAKNARFARITPTAAPACA